MASRAPSSNLACSLWCQCTFTSRNITSRIQIAHISSKRTQNRRNGKVDFTTVQLTKDVAQYGQKGVFLQVPRGLMRNFFHPKRQARYVVGDELKEVKLANRLSQRDTTYATQLVTPAVSTAPEQFEAVKEAMDDRIAELIAETEKKAERDRAACATQQAIQRIPLVIQPVYVFHRKANIQDTSARSDAPGTPIFGSVSALDVAQVINQSLLQDEVTASLNVSEQNIVFTAATNSPTGIVQNRVKELGRYQVQLNLPGADLILTNVDVKVDETGQ